MATGGVEQGRAAEHAAAAVRSERYQTVAEANRRNYASVSRDYARHLHCRADSQEERRLQRLAALARAAIGDRRSALRALDACGGTGNAALQLQALGFSVELVDISPEMIEVYRAECRAAGYEPVTHVGEIAAFFESCSDRYDLIVFSSALHHLENPLAVLTLAAGCLVPGGAIATTFDPISQSALFRALRLPLHWFRRAHRSPSLLFTRALPVLRRLLSGGEAYKERQHLALSEQNMGNLAEFHARRGFDDLALVKRIEESTGLRVVCHERFIGACLAPERWIRLLTRTPNQFQLLLQRSAP